jgi:organic radical activating enzyme
MTQPVTTNERKWAFKELMQDPEVRQRFSRVRKYFFLRESTYDMSNRCNVRCDGCYYFEGEKQFTPEESDPEVWRKLMQAEKERGITYVVLAGAEPALVPDLLQACYDEVPLGAIATNGIKKIPESVGYRIHISVWGNDESSARVRKCKDMLERQLEAYGGDPRAVYVYTFTRFNIPEVHQVMERLALAGGKITFNMFSATNEYVGDLNHTSESLLETRAAMLDVIQKYPDNVLFSPYSAMAHTHKLGLDELFGCSYPRCNKSEFVGLGRSFRQYRTDLSWDRSAACCVPDTACYDCRHYAAGSAVVTARLHRHAIDPERFKGWLDYVDTYLSVWVMGYNKSPNLLDTVVAPPGHIIEP